MTPVIRRKIKNYFVSLHNIFGVAHTKKMENKLEPLEYEKFIKRRLKLETILDDDFLQNNSKIAINSSICNAVINYLANTQDGDSNTSRQRKYEILLNDLFSEDSHFENKINKAKIKTEIAHKRLENFIDKQGIKYKNSEEFWKEVKSSEILSSINCIFY